MMEGSDVVGIIEDEPSEVFKIKGPAPIPRDLLNNPLNQTPLDRNLQLHQHHLPTNRPTYNSSGFSLPFLFASNSLKIFLKTNS